MRAAQASCGPCKAYNVDRSKYRAEREKTLATSVHLLKLFVVLSTLAALAAWQNKKLEQQRPKASRVSSCTRDAAT
jgi:hypothetical protein